MKLLLTGTFDVSNYGDLLFPLIARQQLTCIPGFKLQAASPIGRAPDMTDCEPCVGILDIIEDVSNFNAVLVGGGNVLHCMPSSLDAYKVGMRDKVAYGDLWIGPAFFIPEDIPILWNAPGVPNPIAQEHKMLVAEVLRRVNYLSVRDEMSRQYLADVWPEANIAVVPDSAWMVNHLWTTEQLTSSYEEIFRRIGVSRPNRSVVIHLNRRYVGGLRVRELAERLDRIGKLLEGQLILIAIGRCHGDHVFAKEVSSYMASSPILLDDPRSLQEITACISHAVAYVGSSMHGSITASAFGVPGLCVASQKMIKFRGLIDFIGHTDVLAEEWDEAIEILSGMDFKSHKVDLLAVRDRAHSELQTH